VNGKPRKDPDRCDQIKFYGKARTRRSFLRRLIDLLTAESRVLSIDGRRRRGRGGRSG
jgi:hypothetical protein